MLKKYLFYLIRWQLSTPILAPVVAYFKNSPNIFGTTEDWIGSAVANLIGGLIFFWVDRFIFTGKGLELWQVSEGRCAHCGDQNVLYRLVVSGNYNRTHAEPVFLCEHCSKAKLEVLKKNGIKATGAYRSLAKV